MELDLGPELEAFRQELRVWVEEHRPAGLEDLDERAMYFGGDDLGGRQRDAYQRWSQHLLEARLVCPQWPDDVG
ncbi:MAG TPA: hypothetical protein VKI64_04585, partial [Acidimicrobiales bacterium]|nr:hypothetical protein [Acidimicrobiales bacterium]